MTELIQKNALSGMLLEKLKSRVLWRNILFATVFFHFFTWSFPYTSGTEAEKFLQGLRGEVSEGGWIILTRFIDAIFSFGYAKFAFVLIGLACVLLLYQILARLANEYLAIVGALVFSVNSFLFTNLHRTQPEAVIALIFLACVYLYVRFSTYWHVDIQKSAGVTTYGILFLTFCMLNIDLRSVCLVPSLVMMIFFVRLRVFKPARAAVSTITVGITLGIVQWLLVPEMYFKLSALVEALTHTKLDLAFIDALRTTYVDGYESPLWRNIYKNLGFLGLDNAPHRGRELFVLLIVAATLTGLFMLKIGRLIKSQRTQLDITALAYGPHIPLVVVLGVALLSTTAFQLGMGGVSSTYLFFQVFILILLCMSIYAFFLMSTRGGVQAASEPRWSELVYQPVAAVACFFAAILSLTNAYYYVMPYRGSNYPTLYDALQRRWEGTGCTRLAYAPPLYVMALASRQDPPAKSIDDLYTALSEGKPLADGCVILPLTAKDGVYGYAQAAARMGTPIEQMLKARFEPVAQVVLPFYQKDPAYPLTATSVTDPYAHAHGDKLYGFGGMEEITIYREINSQ